MTALYWITAILMVLHTALALAEDGELGTARVFDMLFALLVAWLLIRTVV